MAQTTDKLPNSRNKWLLIITGVSLTAIATITIYSLNQLKNKTALPETPLVETAKINAISALGRIEPDGKVIKLAASPNMGGAKVEQLLVKEGDKVEKGQIIAILDDYDLKKSEIDKALQDIEVAKANLAIVEAGVKQGEIDAQKATIKKLEAQLAGEINTNQAKIGRLKAQLDSESQEKKATIDLLNAELENAQIELQRYEQLSKDGAISQSVLDQKTLVFNTTKQQLNQAQASYEKTVNTLLADIKEIEAIDLQSVNTLQQQIAEAKANLAKISEVRNVDIIQAQTEVQRAMAIAEKAKIDLELSYIKTPIEGTIIKINARPGENISSDQGVVEIANTQQMLVIAEVYESDINKIKLNQEVTVKSENGAFNGEIKGKVIHISNEIGKKDVLNTDPAADVDARVVEVKIGFSDQDSVKIANLIYSKVLAKILL